MSEFKTSCPQCGQHIQCDEAYRGSKIDCPTCLQSFFATPLAQVMPPPPPLPPPPPAQKLPQRAETTFLVLKDGKQYGSYTLQVLCGYLENGLFAGDDLTWCEGMREWQPLQEVLRQAKTQNPPPPPYAKRKSAANGVKSDKLKPRKKWQVVTIHYFTAGFAIPGVCAILCGLLFFLMAASEKPVDALTLVIMGFVSQILGWIGGTYYSLSYLRKNVTTSDWRGCIAPSIVVAAILDLAWVMTSAALDPGKVLFATLTSVITLSLFGLITAKGFRELDEQQL